MSRPRGAPPQGLIDHDWPHQVALMVEQCTGKNYGPPHAFCRDLSVYSMKSTVSDGQQQYLVFCFAEPEDATKFKEAFGGIPFYPEDRVGKMWKRPPGDVRRVKRRDPYDWS